MDEILLTIAKQHLDLTTLETRKNDTLDFPERAVWQIKKALEEAFKAGQNYGKR